MRRLLAKSGLIFAVMAGMFLSPAIAQQGDGHITYRFQQGDTLIGLAQKYFRNPASYLVVQRQNRILNARRIPVGQTIFIPRSILKYTPSRARFISVRGNVLRSSVAAKNGDNVSEGTTITTAAASFASLALEDGSSISLPSNSSITIRRLRKYLLGESVDYDFDVRRGGARSKVRPHKSKNDQYRVRSPKSVSAVRGTDFQIRLDDATGRDFAEVDEGALAVEVGEDTATDLAAGNGLAVSADGSLTREKLLPAPTLIDPGKTQSKPEIEFRAKQATDESGYRFTWSTDAGFVDLIADRIVTTPQVSLQDVGNGNYYVKARAISASGIQGEPATHAFRRRLNGAKGSAGQADDGFAFKWTAYGDGLQRFHFQLFKDNDGNQAVIDETGLTENRIAISDLPPGDYFWRVGVVQYLEGEVATNWTDLEKITLSQ